MTPPSQPPSKCPRSNTLFSGLYVEFIEDAEGREGYLWIGRARPDGSLEHVTDVDTARLKKWLEKVTG